MRVDSPLVAFELMPAHPVDRSASTPGLARWLAPPSQRARGAQAPHADGLAAAQAQGMTLFWEAPGLGQREDPAICPRMDTPAHRVTRSCRRSLSNPACVPDHRAQVAQGHGRDAYPVWKPHGGCRHLTGARPTHAVTPRVAGARQRLSGRPRWCSATCGSRTAPPPAASPRDRLARPDRPVRHARPARLARPAARAGPSGPGHRRPAHADRTARRGARSHPAARIPWRQQAFLSWAGLRGVMPIVLTTIPMNAAVPGASEAVPTRMWCGAAAGRSGGTRGGALAGRARPG